MMKLNTPVSEIMTKDVYTVGVNNSLAQAKDKCDEFKVRHLPVVSGHKLVGILSLTDILRLSFGDTYGRNETDVDAAMYDMLSIDQVMKLHPKTVKVDDRIKDVVDILVNEEFHALPVVNGEDLAGIITTTDIIVYLAFGKKV